MEKGQLLCDLTTWTIIVGALFFFPVGAPGASSVSLLQLPLIAWAAILFTALGATAVANILWNYGIAHVGVVRMTIYGYLPPILGVILATVLLHETLTLLQWCGALITIVGVGISQYGKAVRSRHLWRFHQRKVVSQRRELVAH